MRMSLEAVVRSREGAMLVDGGQVKENQLLYASIIVPIERSAIGLSQTSTSACFGDDLHDSTSSHVWVSVRETCANKRREVTQRVVALLFRGGGW